MNERLDKQSGFSLIELLIVIAIIMIIASMSIPNLVRSKISANEAAAVEALRTLNSAAVTYMATHGDYPRALSDLGPPTTSTLVSSTAADLIDSSLAQGVKSGYKFSYTFIPKVSGSPMSSYTIIATPATSGVTGQRLFFVDSSGTIRASTDTSVDASSPPLS